MKNINSIEQLLEEYEKSFTEKDYKKTVSFIYPRLFDHISKKTIEDSLKEAYSNDEMDIQLSNFKLNAILYKEVLSNTEYQIIQTKFDQVVNYLKNNKQAQESANLHFEFLKLKYGEWNVKLEDGINKITANSSGLQLVIHVNNTWTLLEIKPYYRELYSNFLPSSIMDQLNLVLQKDDESIFSSSHLEKTKLNTLMEIGNDKNLQVMYLLGCEVFFNGDADCQNFIATQITNKQTFEFATSGLELLFHHGKLTNVNEYNYGEKVERLLKVEEIGLIYTHHEPNVILNLIETANGFHQLGGEIPDDFQLPDNKCFVPFQYLGYIDNQDENFSWLPFKVHLTCPIFLNIGNVFLDYSNQNKPTIINREEVENADTSYDDDLNQNSEIVFNEMKFSFIEDVEFSMTGHSGIPNWIQYPDIPMCPKSGRRMKFLCQLNGGVNAKRTNVVPHKESWRHYYENLNFWGDGNLFVFFEPTSKVACYFIQNT